ncbi:MAG TPA: hypothetical protein VLH79_06875 [Chthonomonadales bacterium]|nr:hypothetical protein [Chthonomonadales bacterium]
MSFATSVQAFATQAARERQALALTTVQPYTGAGAAALDGAPVAVFLSPIRIERELGEAGFITLHKASLRVLKTGTWSPAEGTEFVVVATGDRYRCNSATGADTDFSAEIVCDVVRLSG